MARDTAVQSLVESYQSVKKWYLMSPCWKHRIIRYESRVKWSNPGKGVILFRISQCSNYWKGSLWITLDYGHQLLCNASTSVLPGSFDLRLSDIKFPQMFTSLLSSLTGFIMLWSYLLFIESPFQDFRNSSMGSKYDCHYGHSDTQLDFKLSSKVPVLV